jgi:hypothetical protein
VKETRPAEFSIFHDGAERGKRWRGAAGFGTTLVNLYRGIEYFVLAHGC